MRKVSVPLPERQERPGQQGPGGLGRAWAFILSPIRGHCFWGVVALKMIRFSQGLCGLSVGKGLSGAGNQWRWGLCPPVGRRPPASTATLQRRCVPSAEQEVRCGRAGLMHVVCAYAVTPQGVDLSPKLSVNWGQVALLRSLGSQLRSGALGSCTLGFGSTLPSHPCDCGQVP